MKVICSWCNEIIGEDDENVSQEAADLVQVADPLDVVSHGMCKPCSDMMWDDEQLMSF